jgi:predicted nucleic acid-binding protein
VSRFIVDSSVAASWILPDEAGEVAAGWLRAAWAEPPVAPAHWPVEIANTAFQASKRGRLTDAGLADAETLLSRLAVEVEPAVPARVWRDGLGLAGRHGLTVYDALYLEAALRRGLVLATYDKALLRAAQAEGVAVQLR